MSLGCQFHSWRKIDPRVSKPWFRSDPKEGIGAIAEWIARNYRSIGIVVLNNIEYLVFSYSMLDRFAENVVSVCYGGYAAAPGLTPDLGMPKHGMFRSPISIYA